MLRLVVVLGATNVLSVEVFDLCFERARNVLNRADRAVGLLFLLCQAERNLCLTVVTWATLLIHELVRHVLDDVVIYTVCVSRVLLGISWSQKLCFCLIDRVLRRVYAVVLLL